MNSIVVVALYKFVDLPDFEALKIPLMDCCQAQKITGTLLLASEGINGTIAGSRAGIDAVLDYLRADARFSDLEHKESFTTKPPFIRLKIKLKKEIVTLGAANVNPNKAVGQYIEPEHWNALISDPEVILVDTRNNYEVEVGSFQGAINPQTTTFREFPDYVTQHLSPKKPKKVAMFCTGGIRCEKASAYLLEQGFQEVYHLKGGILKYLETIPEAQSLWQGDCFVFDERVTVTHGLQQGIYDQCYGCRSPISEQDKQSPAYQKGVSCPKCINDLTPEKKAKTEERQYQVELAAKRDQRHIGQKIEKHSPIACHSEPTTKQSDHDS